MSKLYSIKESTLRELSDLFGRYFGGGVQMITTV